MAYTEQTRSPGRSAACLGPLLILALIVAMVVVIATLPEHTRKDLLYFAQDYLPIVMFLTLAALLFSGYPVAFVLGGVATDLRPDRLLPRHLQAGRVLQLRAAHLWPSGREPWCWSPSRPSSSWAWSWREAGSPTTCSTASQVL